MVGKNTIKLLNQKYFIRLISKFLNHSFSGTKLLSFRSLTATHKLYLFYISCLRSFYASNLFFLSRNVSMKYIPLSQEYHTPLIILLQKGIRDILFFQFHYRQNDWIIMIQANILKGLYEFKEKNIQNNKISP